MMAEVKQLFAELGAQSAFAESTWGDKAKALKAVPFSNGFAKTIWDKNAEQKGAELASMCKRKLFDGSTYKDILWCAVLCSGSVWRGAF